VESGSEGKPYVLEDPRPIAEEAPYTFFLPDTAYINALLVGDLVKIVFQYTVPVEQYPAERMWVKISSIENDHFTGVLGNEPYEKIIKYGEIVNFERYHILDFVYETERPNVPAIPPKREYWERCLVDACVLDDSVPVEYIYREVPDLADADDKYPDSGWRIRGKQGDASDIEMEGRSIEYIAVGKVLNEDDSWLNLIDEPVGSAFMRDFKQNIYVRHM